MNEEELTEAQLDGLACMECGLDAGKAGPMVPGPIVDDRHTWRCVTCATDDLYAYVSQVDGAVTRRVAALEAQVAVLQEFVPMLARLAFVERWTSAGSVANAIVRLEEFVGIGDWQPDRQYPPEVLRPDDEPLPLAAHQLQMSYDRRESPWMVTS